MAETMRLGSDPQPDLEQLVMDAKNRWLRPAEICLILKNYRRFRIQSEPPNRPPSGAFFLFDKKLLRYFRKDGHQWRKKKDGKTVKEAHERLKAGSVDVLHCYYAHGEEDDNFQRRSYWMLEEELMHIVFVHYRNVKGSKGSSSRTKDVSSSFYVTQEDALAGSNPMSIPHQVASMDADSPNSGQSSEYEDAENDNCQASSNCAADNSEARSRYAADNCSSGSRYNPFIEMPRNDLMFSADTSHLEPYVPVNLQAPTDDLQGCRGIESDFITLAQADLSVYGRDMGTGYNLPSTSNVSASSNFISNHDFGPSFLPHWPIYTDIDEPVNKKDLSFSEISMAELLANHIGINGQDGTQYQMSHSGDGSFCSTNMDTFVHQDFPVQMGKTMENSFVKHRPLELSKWEGDEGLKKNDSFSRWMSRELEIIDASSYMQSSSGICWDEVENGSADEDSSLSHHGHIDSYALSPSVSQDQLFSIVGFSPSWAYVGLKTKVLVTGTFLMSKDDIERHRWSCMFGEVEVPAEVLADGTLQCQAPEHKAGCVPFYVTCSNRLACSEVRDFEFIAEPSQEMENSEFNDQYPSETLLKERFKIILSMGTLGIADPLPGSFGEKASICNKICSLLPYTDDDRSKLRIWLLHKVLGDENGLTVRDKESQCIIHLAAALDYDWAIEPIVTAGVAIDFRDSSGWSALHWAAYYGRENTVITLISLGASPGPLTDPSQEFPTGRTPADLASSNGHKGIAGFLAKSSLTSHLSTLTFNEGIPNASKSLKATDDDFSRNTLRFNEVEVADDSSLKDSLSAVRDATQAYARIFQAFRVQSFHRRKAAEDESTLPSDHALSLVTVKSSKAGRNVDRLHAAATRIQNKFRGWKGRKDFLVLRQNVIKIQAHVRGHQVRKQKKIFWTIGIVQKVILWRNKVRVPHSPRPVTPMESSTSSQHDGGDDIDLLKLGRKQSEVRLGKALARVKSMVQYPEARDQYRRLVTGVEEMKTKATLESLLSEPMDSIDMDMIDEIEELLGDDTQILLS